MRTYDINEAADFLKVDRSTALELASLGSLPGAKVGRSWVFLEDQLVAYLRDVTLKQTQTRRAQTEVEKLMDHSRKQRRTSIRQARRRPLPELPDFGAQPTVYDNTPEPN